MERRTLLMSLPALALAACGGGGDATAPSIQFSADRSRYFIGEQARLSVRHDGDRARIEPDLGAVADGAVVTTPPLDGPRRYRLVVERNGEVIGTRELALDVRFRDRWSLAGSLQVAQHASAPTADGGVVVIGGDRGLSVLSDAVDRYDPATGAFATVGRLVGGGRSGHLATMLADGRILVTGGITALDIAPMAEIVDPLRGQVDHGGWMRQPRRGHAATRLADGRVLVTGGTGRASAEIWDGRDWRLLDARLQHDRENHSATLLADGRVLIAGGSSLSATYTFAELFDPATERFTPLAGIANAARSAHAAWRAADGSVLLVGGEALDGATLVPLASALRFDPGTPAWGAAPALAVARTLVPAVPLPDGRAVLFGGQTAAARATRRASIWSGQTGEEALAPLPTARAWHTVDRLPDGRLVVIGGEGAAGAFVSDVLVYD